MSRIILILTLLICASPFVQARTPYNQSTDHKEIGWMDLGMDQIRDRLKDPESADFTDVFFSRSGGIAAACGYVNAKNSFGGYIGKQRFFTAGDSVPAILESDMPDFATIWNKFCQ